MHRDEVNSSPSHSLAIVSSLYALQLFYSELLMPVRSSRDAGGILANFRRKMKTRFTNGDKFGSLAHIFFFFISLFFSFYTFICPTMILSEEISSIKMLQYDLCQYFGQSKHCCRLDIVIS